MDLFRKHERTERPLGDDSFIETIELLLHRKLKPQKAGLKKLSKVFLEFPSVPEPYVRFQIINRSIDIITL